MRRRRLKRSSASKGRTSPQWLRDSFDAITQGGGLRSDARQFLQVELLAIVERIIFVSSFLRQER
jgi:hypothetical protein